MIKVLLVEDDEAVAGVLRYYFDQMDNYEVTYAATAGETLAKARNAYDVILLDVMLPDISGIDLCTQLRQWHSCPIIFISCIEDNDVLIDALQKGGDDYLTKPFDNRVLDARIQANLRRVSMDQKEEPANELTCKRFKLDTHIQELRIGRKRVELLPTEYKILLHLMQHPNQYFTPSELYSEIWDKPSYGDTRTVTVHIYNLRKKIEADPKNPKYLVNTWGKGYRFDPQGKG